MRGPLNDIRTPKDASLFFADDFIARNNAPTSVTYRFLFAFETDERPFSI